jgi:hypothetical protein
MVIQGTFQFLDLLDLQGIRVLLVLLVSLWWVRRVNLVPLDQDLLEAWHLVILQ